MKPHPELRKTIKWAGAAVMVLLVVVWMGNGVFDKWNTGSQLFGGPYAWRLQGGGLGFGRFLLSAKKPVFVESPGYIAIPALLQSGRDWYVNIPLWMPAAMMLVPSIIAWRLDAAARRREREGKCSKCNYDRTGLAPTAVCPECGATPSR